MRNFATSRPRDPTTTRRRQRARETHV